jgi:serine/threonine protein phosphatase PrpC
MAETTRPPISDAFRRALIDGITSQKWDVALHRTVEDLGLAYASHPGLKRRRNEDRLAIAQVQSCSGERYTLAIVCDGVGGSENGDRAATLAIAGSIIELCAQRMKVPLGALADRLIRAADEFVRAELKGRGTTTMALLLAAPSGQCIAANIGDSRVYAWNPSGELVQISTDDTVENELRALPGDHRGFMQAHHLRGRISQAIGEPGRGSEDLRIVGFSRSAFPAGVILGTDGLWRAADSFDAVVANSEGSAEAVRRAVQLANWCGGGDNASIVAIGNLDKFCAFSATNVPPSLIGATVWIAESKLQLMSEVIFEQKAAPKPVAGKNKRKTSKVVKQRESREPELPLTGSDSKGDSSEQSAVTRDDAQKSAEPRPAIEVTLDKAGGRG